MKTKQTVANTAQKKGDLLDIDNDNLQHTKLLWGLTTSEQLHMIKNRKNIVRMAMQGALRGLYVAWWRTKG